METQRFSPPGPDPGLRGGDRDVFLRVWQRVMPEEREGPVSGSPADGTPETDMKGV